MPYTEAYREHIMYTFNSYYKTVIRFAAINAWRDRSRRRQKEISLEYLTEGKQPKTRDSHEKVRLYLVKIAKNILIFIYGSYIIYSMLHFGTNI